MKRSTRFATVVRSALLLAPLAAGPPAQAALLRIDFSGKIDEVTASGPGALGQRFTGTLYYDDAGYRTHLNPTVENLWALSRYESGSLLSTGAIVDGTGLDVKIAGQSVAPESTGLIGGTELSMSGMDPVGIRYGFSSHARDQTGYYARGVGVSFETSNLDLFRDGKVPEGLKLSDLTKAHVTINSAMFGEFRDEAFVYQGTIDSLTVTPVPEPAWTVAALLGAALWVVRRRQAA